jgi:hypothetical protein
VDALTPVLLLPPLVVEVPVAEVPAVVVVPAALVIVVDIVGFNEDWLFFGRSFSGLVAPSTPKEEATAVFVSSEPSGNAASFSGRVVMVRF